MEMDSVNSESPFKSPAAKILKHQFEFESPFRRSRTDGNNTENSFCDISDQNQVEPDIRNEPSASSGSNGSDYARVNPFEKDVLASLHKSFCSPSIMEVKDTSPVQSTFWAIDQLAHLCPKDIENSPSTHQNSFPVDEQTEAKAQADIENYFKRNRIVPTPTQTRIKVSTKWTQTALSFPKDLPPQMEELLSSFMTQTDEMCGQSIASDVSSVDNSIRRRLELSFGDDQEDQHSHHHHKSPVSDPFRTNHVMSTPTSELDVVQVMRSEFTPETHRMSIVGITPIGNS